MLLNEFLKEHRKVESLETKMAQQQKDFKSTTAQQQKDFQSALAQQQTEIQALTAGLQKVSNQFEMTKPAARVVANN